MRSVKSFGIFSGSVVAGAAANKLNPLPATVQAGSGLFNVRRLNQLGTWDGSTWTPNPFATRSTANAAILTICKVDSSFSATEAGKLDDVANTWGSTSGLTASFAIADALATGPDSTTGTVLTIPSFESDFGTGMALASGVPPVLVEMKPPD